MQTIIHHRLTPGILHGHHSRLLRRHCISRTHFTLNTRNFLTVSHEVQLSGRKKSQFFTGLVAQQGPIIGAPVSMSGGIIIIVFDLLQRFKVRMVSMLARSCSTYFDVNDEVCRKMKQEITSKPRRDRSYGYRNKYLFDMDGNSFSGRFIMFLQRSKSLIYRMALFTEWVDNFVRKNFHFIEVNPNLEKLEEQLEWAREHDANVAKMVETTHDFSNAYLGFNGTRCYTFRLLLEYSSLVQISSTTR